MGHDVFLSYSSKNGAAAEAVCSALERRGVGVWMAPRDIAPGASWAGSIVDAIDGARAVVLVFSSAANESGQIEREVQRALEKNLRVIPFRIEDVKPKEALAYCIGAVQWLDAFAPPMEPHYEALAKVVRRIAAPQGDVAAPTAASVGTPVTPPAAPSPPQRQARLVPILAAVVVAGLAAAGLIAFQLSKGPSPTPIADQDRPAGGMGVGSASPTKTGELKLAPPEESVANAANTASRAGPSKFGPPSGGFGIVFGTDNSPKAAMDEVRKALKPPISARPVLFKKNGSWASVATFDTRDAATEQLPKFKGIRSSAFIVDISSWCPSQKTIAEESPDMAEQRDCGT